MFPHQERVVDRADRYGDASRPAHDQRFHRWPAVFDCGRVTMIGLHCCPLRGRTASDVRKKRCTRHCHSCGKQVGDCDSADLQLSCVSEFCALPDRREIRKARFQLMALPIVWGPI